MSVVVLDAVVLDAVALDAVVLDAVVLDLFFVMAEQSIVEAVLLVEGVLLIDSIEKRKYEPFKPSLSAETTPLSGGFSLRGATGSFNSASGGRG